METKVSKFTVTGLVKERRIFNTSMDFSVDVFHYPCLTGDNGTGKSLTIHLLHAMTELITTSIPTRLFSYLRTREEDGWGQWYWRWHKIFQKLELEMADGRKLTVSAIDPADGKYMMNMNDHIYDLDDVPVMDIPDTVPFLSDKRHENKAGTVASLVFMNGGKFDPDKYFKLCQAILGLDNGPRIFTPMPMGVDFSSRAKWERALDTWLGTFSHGEIEVLMLSLAVEAVGLRKCPIFIEGAEAGLHVLSQKQFAKMVPMFDERGIQIVYTTRSPFNFIPGQTYDIGKKAPVKEFVDEQ